MSALAWGIVAVLLWLAALVFTLALCRAAALADQAIEQMRERESGST